jgi:hypothetical protein
MSPVSVVWVTAVGLWTISTAVWIVALVDCAYRKFPTSGEKWGWLALVGVGHLLGAIVYWAVGRERGTLNSV